MDLHTFTRQRLSAVLRLSHGQHVPYSSPVEMLTIPTSDGIELGATRWMRGQRKLIIICHGFGANQRSLGMVWLAEALVGSWDILTFDWRGYSRSTGQASLGGDEALDLLAVLEFARTEGYQRVGVIAESMGGLITLATLGTLAAVAEQKRAAASRYPDRLVTTGAPADYSLTGLPRPQAVRYLAPQPWARPLAPLMGMRLGPLKIPHPLEAIAHIHIPTLVIHGDADTVVPVRSAHLIGEHIPGAQVHIYPRVGHGIEAMRLQVPQWLLRDLRAHFEAM